MRKATIKELKKAAMVAYVDGNYNTTFDSFFRIIKKNYNELSVEEKRKAKLGAKEVYTKWISQLEQTNTKKRMVKKNSKK